MMELTMGEECYVENMSTLINWVTKIKVLLELFKDLKVYSHLVLGAM